MDSINIRFPLPITEVIAKRTRNSAARIILKVESSGNLILIPSTPAIKGGLDEKIAINSLVLGVIVSLFTITMFVSYLA